MTLSASGLPTIDEGQPIRDAVIDFTEAGSAINTVAGNIHRTWQGLAPQYHAPEQHLVLQAMNTPQTKAKDLWDKAVKAGKALTTYANRCDELQAQKNTLVKDIGSFYKKKEEQNSGNDNPLEWLADKTGWDDLQQLRDEEALLGRCNQLQADLDEAQRTCANAIGAIYGGPQWEAYGQTSVDDQTVYGFTKDGYEQMAKSGDTPWGHPEGWQGKSLLTQGYMIVGGAWETIASTGGFIWDLTGLSEDGEASAAWSGLWQLTKDASKFGSAPLLLGSLATDPKGVAESGERLLNVGKAAIGWDNWDTSPYQTAGGFVPDIIAAAATGGSSAAVRGSMKAAMSALARHAPGVANKIGDLSAAARAMKASLGGHLNFDLPETPRLPDGDRPESPNTPDRTPDSGTPDSNTPDRTPDSGTPDSNTPDRTPDSGTPDSNTPDRTPDSGTPDSNTPDRTPDSGTPDSSTPEPAPHTPPKPDAFDTSRGDTYDSGDAHHPGDSPAHTPESTFTRGDTESGWAAVNRGPDKPWMDYQEQISGIDRTPEGHIPEYMQVNPETGRPVAFDGRTLRGDPPQEVFLDSKNGYAALAFRPDSAFSVKVSDSLTKEAGRQLDALPPGAKLEWHVSNPHGAAAIRELLADNDLHDIDVIYTPKA